MGASTTTEAQKDTEEPNKVIIKPNVYSWRSIRVSTLELVSMGITKVGNIYGFDQSTYDAHASKNTEWALISYLTQSQYGKYGNSLYAGESKQVYINNYNGYKTGCSSGTGTASSVATCTYKYDDITSQGEGTGYGGGGASTTGNITGIYDINGGAWESVMGVLEKRTGNTQEANSGYSGLLTDGSEFTSDRVWPDDKYLDIYISSSTETACEGNPCKGHAMNEVAGWYGDASVLVHTICPWSNRSGYPGDGTWTGVFHFGNSGGSGSEVASFRIVLTPQN